MTCPFSVKDQQNKAFLILNNNLVPELKTENLTCKLYYKVVNMIKLFFWTF